MEKNKTGKYFKYAIGEIILVVIGILIALQINNWNEQRKSNKLEVKILNEIRSNLKTDIIEIRDDIALMEDLNKAVNYIVSNLKNNNEPTDSLRRSFAALRLTPHFSPITSGYKLLQSKGIGLIRNDSLRNSISTQYELLYPYYKTYEVERSRFHSLHTEPILLNYFNMNFSTDIQVGYLGLNFKIEMDDYSKLQMDKQFAKLIKAIAFENQLVQDRAERVEQNILKLNNEIIRELDRKL